jgi:hypothetical protein
VYRGGRVSVVSVGGEILPVVAVVHRPSQRQFSEVADALDALSLLLGLRQRRQKHRRQNGNNGDDDQQFDQRKTDRVKLPSVVFTRVFHCLVTG